MKRGRKKKKMVSMVNNTNVSVSTRKRNSSYRTRQATQQSQSSSSPAIIIDDSSSDLDLPMENPTPLPSGNSVENSNVKSNVSLAVDRFLIDDDSSDLEITTVTVPTAEIPSGVQENREQHCLPEIREKKCDNETGSKDFEIDVLRGDIFSGIERKRGRRCFPTVGENEDENVTEDLGVISQPCRIYSSQVDKYRENKNKLVAGLQHLNDLLSDEDDSDPPPKSSSVPSSSSSRPSLSHRTTGHPSIVKECSPQKICPVKRKKPKTPKKQKKLYSNLEKLISNFREGEPGLDSSLTEDSFSLVSSTSPTKLHKTFLVTVKCKKKIIPCHLDSNEEFCKLFPKISSVMDVPVDSMKLFLDGKLLDEFQTPLQVNFVPGTFIECLVSTGKKAETDPASQKEDSSLIEINIQSNTERKKVAMKCNKLQPLQKLLEEYAALKNLDPQQLKFCFDGETVDLSDSPADLEMEDGDCLDVVIHR